jgi:GNAT superfamily N-acetyltransferase
MTPRFTTKELTLRTWGDFERFFRKPGEWGACWCIYYHRSRPLPEPEGKKLTLEQRAARNRRDKRDLVEKGCSHGVLVYSGREPVGWCQYGPKKELPRIDAGRKYRRLTLGANQDLWRVTCFCVDRKFRNQKVASVALAAALRSIRRKGGRTVEAYPVTRRGALAVWFGTVSMFENQGFEVVAPFGKSNVVMRRTL